MAHFAELGENNIVLRVIAVHNNELLDENENEIEQKGVDFCTNLFGGVWKQTSYNGNFRKQFAGTGFHYDSVRDEFVLPQPYSSWSIDLENNWIPPKPKPTDIDFCYHWNESLQEWQKY